MGFGKREVVSSLDFAVLEKVVFGCSGSVENDCFCTLLVVAFVAPLVPLSPETTARLMSVREHPSPHVDRSQAQ